MQLEGILHQFGLFSATVSAILLRIEGVSPPARLPSRYIDRPVASHRIASLEISTDSAAMIRFSIPAFFLGLAELIAGAALAESPLTFEHHVRPILKAHCFQCHGETADPQGKLDLRLQRLIIQGGESGAAIVAGKPEASLMLNRIEQGEMPPKGGVTPAELQILRRWIAEGAKTAAPEPDDPAAAAISTIERAFWAFQPIRIQPTPIPASVDGLRNPIDGWLESALEERGLKLSPVAPAATIARRLAIDLWGLPMSPEEVADLVADDAPDAHERTVDRLIASPRYGEHWGRHWLDTAGYADSDGYSETDPVRPYAYKYRDYIIRSYNADKPWDQFLIEQLAGDELVANPPVQLKPEEMDRLAATGFLRLVPDGTASGAAVKEAANAVVAESIKVFSTSVLGMTVGCAQCHDHRYDPIPQTDYYRLRAIFEPAFDLTAWRAPAQRLVSLYTNEDRAKAAEIETQATQLEAARTKKQDEYIAGTLEKELAKIAEDRRELVRAARNTPADKRTPEQSQLLKEFPSVNVDAGSLYLYDNKAAEDLKKEAEAIAKLRGTKPVEDFISVLSEVPGRLPETSLFVRGDPDQPGVKLQPGDLSVLSEVAPVALPIDDASLPTSGRRLAYARHLTNGQHPLTSRVAVNQLWHHHFGRGIVGTPGDFGVLGEKPTHPELLDWLASRFNASGRSEPSSPNAWSVKRMHRLILTSTAWQQSSRRRADLENADPDNRLLGRFPVRRMTSECVRDTMLATNGMLYNKSFGPAVPVMEDDVGQIVVGIENKNGENRPGPIIPMHGEDCRRSVYIQIRRTRLLGMLDTFDLPTMEPNCSARNSSTVTPQSLLMMNSDFALTASRDFATRLEKESVDPVERIRRAFLLAYGRPATEADIAAAQGFLAEQQANFSQVAAKEADASKRIDPAHWALASFCQAIFSSNEFLYVE